MRSASKSFPLKEGLCVLHHDRIELEHTGIKGWWLAWANKRKLTSVGFWYVMAGLGFFVMSILSIIIDNWFLAFFFVLFMALCIGASWYNRQASLRISIAKSEIEQVIFHEAIAGQSRASFEVFFRPNKYLRVRRLSLPGRHQQGAAIANSAMWMMKEEGLL
ncbi:MAG: hypothetical protein NWR72_16220 [Bacteroidia bacterium]|nr:hypothetical protein [Bacteroidia bacterium]